MSQSIVVGERRGIVGNIFVYAILIFGALISIFPFYWMAVIATSDRSAVFKLPPKITFSDQLFVNFGDALEKIYFFRSMFNSLVVSGSITISVLFFCTIAGYAFSKYVFAGRKFLFFFVLATLLIPSQLSVLPVYQIIADLGWIDSYLAIIVPALVNAFGIFWMKQYIDAGVNNELLEAGRIDGASHFRIFTRIVLPIVTPAMATLGIFTFMNVWNDFFWPLVVLKNKINFTIQIAIQSLFVIRDGIPYGMIMATIFFATLPLLVVFLLFSRWFISGLTQGAIKS